MSGDTIRKLLASARQAADRRAVRLAWARRRLADLEQAETAMHQRCCDAVERLDEAAFERLCDSEQAKVDAILTELRAVTDADKWPREMYFAGI